MQPVRFGRFLAPVLIKLAVIAAIALTVGTAADAAKGWTTAAVLLALYVAGFVYALWLTLRWLEGTERKVVLDTPVGEWNSIASTLYRTRKREAAVRAELDQSVAQLRLILERIPDGVVIVDGAMNIAWCNPTAESQLGINLARDGGLRLTNLVRDPDFVTALVDAAADEQLVRFSQAGQITTLSVRVITTSPEQRMVVTRDVSAAERLDVMRRDFIANVSHELRTPLTVLSGFLELASPIAPLSEMHLQLMREEAGRMQRLIEDLLTLSRLESSLGPSREETVDLSRLAAAAMASTQALSAGRHVFDTAIEPILIRGSGDEVESALKNLLSNAVRYTPEGGRIRLSIKAGDEGARLTVTDSGMGIAAEHVPRLTERFYRVDKSRSRDTGGTGLGLAIVKHVMLRHQGRLEITSQLGSGSTFTLCFPRNRLIIKE
jgi:two-component system phosphate regulon sensor histidine kinase PhoR